MKLIVTLSFILIVSIASCTMDETVSEICECSPEFNYCITINNKESIEKYTVIRSTPFRSDTLYTNSQYSNNNCFEQYSRESKVEIYFEDTLIKERDGITMNSYGCCEVDSVFVNFEIGE